MSSIRELDGRMYVNRSEAKVICYNCPESGRLNHCALVDKRGAQTCEHFLSAIADSVDGSMTVFCQYEAVA